MQNRSSRVSIAFLHELKISASKYIPLEIDNNQYYCLVQIITSLSRLFFGTLYMTMVPFTVEKVEDISSLTKCS